MLDEIPRNLSTNINKMQNLIKILHTVYFAVMCLTELFAKI